MWKGNNPILSGLTNHSYSPLTNLDDPQILQVPPYLGCWLVTHEGELFHI